MFRNKFIALVTMLIIALCCSSTFANEVPKGQIPGDHLTKSLKQLPWGVTVWDVDEAVASLKSNDKLLWVDTRPSSFFEKGTIRDAVQSAYDMTGKDGNELTPETLEAAINAAGMSKDTARIVFFCQGPKCHRSYNAAYKAVTDWGYDANNIIWFRAGYPHLFKEIQTNAKLKRKAKKYISDAGVKQL